MAAWKTCTSHGELSEGSAGCPWEVAPSHGDLAPGGLSRLVERVPLGWTAVEYDGRRFGLTRTDRAQGRSVAIYAEELGGGDVVSANVYRTSGGDELRPCEMPAAKVLAFLRGWRA